MLPESSSSSTWNSTRATPVDGWHCACGEGNAFAQSGRMLESANTAHVSTPVAADMMFTSTVLVICWLPIIMHRNAKHEPEIFDFLRRPSCNSKIPT